MPVETGFVPDDEIDEIEIPAEATATDAELPIEPGGLAVIAAEPGPAEDDPVTPPPLDQRPFVEVQGRIFHVRTPVPGMLLMTLSDTALRARTGGTQGELFSTLARSLNALVVAEERNDFMDWLLVADPPIEMNYLITAETGLVSRMLAASSGRPTPSASL